MRIFFLLFLLIVLILNVSAILPLNIQLNRNEFAPGETVFATITKNLILQNEINEFDFTLLKNSTRIPLSTSLLKEYDNYYLYFNIPDYIEEGTYYFQDNNILYTDENNVFRKTTQSVQLEVKKTNSSVLSISPLFVRVINPENNPEYTIRIRNVGNTEPTVFISKEDNFIILDKTFVNIPKLSTQKINFLVKDELITKNIALLTLKYEDKSYDILIFINKDLTQVNQTIVIPENAVQFIEESKLINLTLDNETREGSIKFKNFFNETINNIEFELTGNLNQIITLRINKLDSLQPNEISEQYIWINQNKNASPGIYQGDLVMKYSNTQTKFPIYIKINELTEQNITIQENKTSIFEPEIKTNYTKPSKKKEGPQLPWTLIIIIIVLVIVGLLILYFKKKKPVKQTLGQYVKDIEKDKYKFNK